MEKQAIEQEMYRSLIKHYLSKYTGEIDFIKDIKLPIQLENKREDQCPYCLHPQPIDDLWDMYKDYRAKKEYEPYNEQGFFIGAIEYKMPYCRNCFSELQLGVVQLEVEGKKEFRLHILHREIN